MKFIALIVSYTQIQMVPGCIAEGS